MAARLWHPGRRRIHTAEVLLEEVVRGEGDDYCAHRVAVTVTLEIDGLDIYPAAAPHGTTEEGLSLLLTDAEQSRAEHLAADEWREA